MRYTDKNMKQSNQVKRKRKKLNLQRHMIPFDILEWQLDLKLLYSRYDKETTNDSTRDNRTGF